MTARLITVVDDDAFNTGWLDYLLGLPEPEGEDSPEHDGWVIAASQQGTRPIRAVFQQVGMYDISAPVAPKVKAIPEGEKRAMDGNR